jgi:hypothetical protein
MNPNQMDEKTKKAMYEVIPSGKEKAQPKQQSVAAECMRGNFDALDRVHPDFGWAMFALACGLLVFGLWMKRKEKKPADDGFAGMC